MASIRTVPLFAFAFAAGLCGCLSGDRPTSSEPDSERAGYWSTEHVRDYQYADGRIFDLAYPGEIGPYDSVRSIYVFVEETHPPNPAAQTFYLDCGPIDPTDTYDRTPVLMREVGIESFELLYGLDTLGCPVALVFATNQRFSCAVFMEIARHDAEGNNLGVDSIGYYGPGFDTLRIVRPASSDLCVDHPAWQLIWRNCYAIPRDVAAEDIEIRVFKGLPATEGDTSNLDYQVVNGVPGDPYIEIMGLDQWDNAHPWVKMPDGIMDFRAETFHPDWGLIILPEREPFNSSRMFRDLTGSYSDPLAVKVPSLYYYYTLVEKIGSSTYYFEIRYWIPDPCSDQ